MELTELVNELKDITNGKKMSETESKKVISKRIKLPKKFSGFHGEKAFINFSDNNNFDNDRGPEYELLIEGQHGRSLDEIEPLLRELFLRAKGMTFPKGVEYERDIFWSREDFQKENNLSDLDFSRLEITSDMYDVDTTKIRFSAVNRNNIRARMEGNKMTLSATGKYREKLRNLAKKIKPQLAKIVLSEDDAERIIRATERNPFGKYFSKAMKLALQPQERLVARVGSNGRVSRSNIGVEDLIEMVIPAKFLEFYERDVGKSLIAAENESGVTEFTKFYGPFSRFSGRRLSDLQSIARDISEMDLGLIYEQPLMNTHFAKELLDKEIELVRQGFSDVYLFGANSHLVLPDLVKRLVTEHFKDDFGPALEAPNMNDFLNFLKTRGYVLPSPKEGKNRHERGTYSRVNGLKDKGMLFDSHLEYAQERDFLLLDFFCQSYARDPKESVLRFRDFYQNKAPRMRISSESFLRDSGELRDMRLPHYARLKGFRLFNHKSGFGNDLNLGADEDGDESPFPYFYVETNLNSPLLLPLQDYACKEMGITFK